MEFRVEQVEPTKYRAIAVFPEGEAKGIVKQALERLAKKVTIRGFRPGKVPKEVLLRVLGKEAVEDEIWNLVGNKVVAKLDESFERPIYGPRVEKIDLDVESPREIVVEVVFESLPEFSVVEEFKKEGKKRFEEIREKLRGAIRVLTPEERLEALRKEYATYVPVEREARKGDIVVADVFVQPKGAKEPLEYENQEILVEDGALLWGAKATGLVGVKTGDEKVLEGKVGGQATQVVVKVKAVKEPILPEVDDEFAKEVDEEAQTLEDLRKKLEQEYERDLKELDREIKMRALRAALAQLSVPVPKALVKKVCEDMRSEGKQAKEEEVEQALKRSIIYDKLVEESKLKEEEIEEKLLERLAPKAKEAGMTVEEYVEALKESGDIEGEKEEVKRELALQRLLEQIEAEKIC